MILILGGTTEGRTAVKVADEAGKPYFYSTKAKEKQKIQHDLHPSGRTCAEGHGMNDEKVDLATAAIIAGLFKTVPDLQ